jgi:hypothetical protein
MALDEVFLMLDDVMLNALILTFIILSVMAPFQVNKLSLMFVSKSWVVYPLVTKIEKAKNNKQTNASTYSVDKPVFLVYCKPCLCGWTNNSHG